VTLRDILQWPDPRLSQVCTPVTADVSTLVSDMFETMYAAPGRGLAAPQVGVMQRVFVMDEHWKQGTPTPIAFINPEITAVSDDTATGPEGCLSIPGILADITRPATVTMRWTDLAGATQTQSFTGFAAACVQHELDHLNGTVTFDHLDPATRAAKTSEYRT
jgi:peptide deformylase